MAAPVKISDLTSASALTGAESVPMVQSSTTKKGLVSAIGTYVRGLFTTTPATVAEGGTNAATVTAARTSLGLGTGDSPTFTGVTAALTGTVGAVTPAAGAFTTLSASGAATLASVAGAAVATQAQQETGTAVDVVVTPGRQHFHASAAKAWGVITMSAGTPTLAASYNITGIADTGTGIVGVTIATDFSSANYVVVATVERAGLRIATVDSKLAGSFNLYILETTGASDDYVSVSFVCFGDQ
jgi:hypothetical protein